MESHPGGGGGALSLAAEESTHNTLQHICREERLDCTCWSVMSSDFNHILLIKLKSRIFLFVLKGTVHPSPHSHAEGQLTEHKTFLEPTMVPYELSN